MQSDSNRRYKILPIPTSRRSIDSLLKFVGNDAIAGLMYSDIEMTWANNLRKQLKKAGQNVTITAMLLKAIAVAQTLHPESRTECLPFGRRVTYREIVAGFTVERTINGQPTVLLGEIESPLEKSMEQIGIELKQHAEDPIDEVHPLFLQNFFASLPGFMRAMILQVGKCFPQTRLLCQKATFGLTSLGKWGINSLTCPCLCACSLSVGSMEEKVVVRDGAVVIRSIMRVGINFDQRALDHPSAARFLQTVRRLMEGELIKWLPEAELVNPVLDFSPANEEASDIAFTPDMKDQSVVLKPASSHVHRQPQ